MRRRGSLWCFVVLLALAGPVAPAYAEGAWPDLRNVWAWLESWLHWTVATRDQCSHIDPNGGCGGGLAAAITDQCGMIDPDGRCGGGNSATSDQGLSIDPDG